MNKEVPILFKKKEECCACGACLNVCPKQAIVMNEDEYGYLYPVIDEKKCVRCGKCKKVCSFQNVIEKNKPLETFAAISKSKDIRMKSASGGIFASMAKKYVENQGLVVGAELKSDFSVHHIIISENSEIYKIQGSKYVQSSTDKVFSSIKQYLKEGKNVLFSGTPCQVAGLSGYLGKEFDNLLTVDIVCHGVPGTRMFQNYINVLKNKKGKVTNFLFRDKNNGWGKNGSAIINNRKVKIWQSSSSYLYYFSKGWIYRDSCYKCPYACSHRSGDITLGDYWGIEKQHPEYLGNNKWDEQKGISLVIANTQKGIEFLNSIKDILDMRESSFEKAALANAQLNYPSMPGQRETILEIYLKGGWEALEKKFRKNIGWRYYSSQIKSFIPKKVKRMIKASR